MEVVLEVGVEDVLMNDDGSMDVIIVWEDLGVVNLVLINLGLMLVNVEINFVVFV